MTPAFAGRQRRGRLWTGGREVGFFHAVGEGARGWGREGPVLPSSRHIPGPAVGQRTLSTGAGRAEVHSCEPFL